MVSERAFESLDPDPGEFRELGYEAVDMMAGHFAQVREVDVFPDTTPPEVAAATTGLSVLEGFAMVVVVHSPTVMLTAVSFLQSPDGSDIEHLPLPSLLPLEVYSTVLEATDKRLDSQGPSRPFSTEQIRRGLTDPELYSFDDLHIGSHR